MHTSFCSAQLPSRCTQEASYPRRPLAFRSPAPPSQPRFGQRAQRSRTAAAGNDTTQEKWEAENAEKSMPLGKEQPGSKVEIPDELMSDGDRKQQEADRLRAAEKFMKVGTGEATCQNCNYKYSPRAGDDEYPVPKGTQFGELPGDWQCPVCGAGKKGFKVDEQTVAGFAENQSYGLGTNAMTEGQKSLLIYGSLAGFFVLFLLGYLL